MKSRVKSRVCLIYFCCFLLSVITSIQGTVSIVPMENAKTFVNGNLISESTVLHHVSWTVCPFVLWSLLLANLIKT